MVVGCILFEFEKTEVIDKLYMVWSADKNGVVRCLKYSGNRK